MVIISKHSVRSLTAALFSTAAFSGFASAANLPDIPADQIRQDTQQRYNPETRRTEFIAPSFDPFELDDTLAGTAALRSASYGTTIDGRRVTGGAFLDLSLFYTTDSNDPYDMRAVERGVYVSGQPVDSISYDAQILDCSENTREVIYDDSYYSGARYGYLAGVYRLFPRYRGHRGFGHRYYGRRGHRTTYGYRDGYRGRHHVGSGRRGDRARGERDHADRDGRRDGRNHADRDGRRDGNADGRRGGRNGGDRDRTPVTRADNGQLVTIPNTQTTRPARTRRAERGTKERVHQDMRRNTRHNRKDPKRYQSSGSQSTNTTPKRPTRTVKAPTIQSTPRQVQTVKVPPPKRARPVPARTQSERTVPKTPQSNRRAISRSVDRHFGGKKSIQKGGKGILNFYPMQMGGYQRADVYVSYRCAREETLTLHIPQERLDAARFDGFTVLLLDRQDREIPVYIPPNYVEGFRQAAGQAQYSVPDPALNPHSGYPQPGPERNPNSPIIYGDTGTY